LDSYILLEETADLRLLSLDLEMIFCFARSASLWNKEAVLQTTLLVRVIMMNTFWLVEEALLTLLC